MQVRLSLLDPSPLAWAQTSSQAIRDSVTLARAADAWGYHRVWFAEHHAPGVTAGRAPAVLTAAVAARTERIRVGSGGVLLRHHRPRAVAAAFGVLADLYPGRIDLGVARGEGASPEVAAALRTGPDGPAPFESALDELLDLVREGRLDVEPWLLGASAASARLAAARGMSYGFGGVRAPRGVLDEYRRAAGSGPKTALAVAVVCAPTMREARRLAASHWHWSRANAAGTSAVLPPGAAAGALGLDGDLDPLTLYPALIAGDPVTVRSALTALRRRFEVDEFVVATTLHDLRDRLRSYDLLAETMQDAPIPLHPAPSPLIAAGGIQ